MSDIRTAVEDADIPNRSECWCCGLSQPPERLARLGNHPEVGVCLRCARYLHKQARGIEDHDRGGPFVIVRDQLRYLRRGIIEKGWSRRPIIGMALRWIGRYTP
jgi:hypothetical protein